MQKPPASFSSGFRLRVGDGAGAEVAVRFFAASKTALYLRREIFKRMRVFSSSTRKMEVEDFFFLIFVAEEGQKV